MTAAPATLPAPELLATRPRGRRLLAVLTPLGPLAMVGWALASPYDPTSTVDDAAAAIATQSTGAQLGVVMLIAAGVLGSIGSLVVGAAVRPGSPRLGAVAAAMSFVGFGIAAYPGPVPAIAASSTAGLSGEGLVRFADAIDAQLQGTVTAALFVCLPAGILLLGVAALLGARRHAYPLPAAVALTAAVPLVLAGGFVSGTALAAGWAVVAVAFGAAGVRYATSPTGPGAAATPTP